MRDESVGLIHLDPPFNSYKSGWTGGTAPRWHPRSKVSDARTIVARPTREAARLAVRFLVTLTLEVRAIKKEESFAFSHICFQGKVLV